MVFSGLCLGKAEFIVWERARGWFYVFICLGFLDQKDEHEMEAFLPSMRIFTFPFDQSSVFMFGFVIMKF